VPSILLIPQLLVGSRSDLKLIVESPVAACKHFMVPYQENAIFVGRVELLTRLFEMLRDSKEFEYNHRVALYGLGGVGKTQTALKYVYSKRDCYHSIFWVSAVDQATLVTEFQKILTITQPDVPFPDSSDQLARLVITWLEKHPSWLIVFDNLDDINVIDGFLPVNSNQKHTLITTRNPSAENIPAQGLEIEIMSPADAIDFFLLRAAFPRDSERHRSEAAKIIEELGYLPLAIEQAAAYTRESKREIEDYLPLYQKSRDSRRHHYKWVPHGPRPYQYSVATTWNISIFVIQEDQEYGEVAQSLLRLFAFLNPDGILLEFLQRGVDAFPDNLKSLIVNDVRFEEALQLLQRFSLIKILVNPRTVTMHRMVQEVIQHGLDDDELSTVWDIIGKFFLLAYPLVSDRQSRIDCRKYQNQILPSLLRVPANLRSEPVYIALHSLTLFLLNDGKSAAAREIAETTVPMAECIWGPKSEYALEARIRLSVNYSSLGLYEQALSLALYAFTESSEKFGEKHDTTLRAMTCVAYRFCDLGRPEDGIKLMEIAFEARKEVLGEKDPETISAQTDLALCYEACGRSEEAMIHEERGLAAKMETFGERDERTLMAMKMVARRCMSCGVHEDARSLLLSVSEICMEDFGDQHPLTLSTMSGLSNALNHLGRLEEALHFAVQAADGAETCFGKDHPETDIYRRNVEFLRAKVEAGPGVMNSDGGDNVDVDQN
jgi:NB-ARC domain/Tetratricopeptide repeat